MRRPMSSSPSCKFYGRKLKGMMVRCNRIRSFDKSVPYSIRFVFHTCGKMGLDLPMGLLLYDWFSSGLINVANGLFVSQVASLFVERLAKSCAVHKSSQLPSIYWYAKVNIRYQPANFATTSGSEVGYSLSKTLTALRISRVSSFGVD
jgi:hypothetical protein